MDRYLTGTVTDILCRQFIHTTKKELHITVAEDLLPLVKRVSVLQPRKVLEHAAHTDISGTDNADLSAKVRNHTAGGKLLTEHMYGNRKSAAGTVLIRIPYKFDKNKRQEQ